MDFVRKVIDGEKLNEWMEIPSSFMNRKVEVLIFPVEVEKEKGKKKKSLSGFLSKYADSNLIGKEENIWLKEAKE